MLPGSTRYCFPPLLTTAYSRSDLSLVYPVARGSAPVLVLAGAAVVGATVGWVQAVGVLLVGCGIVLVRGPSGDADAVGLVLALAIGASIAGYTLVDKEGVDHARVIPYFELVLVPVAFAALAWHAVRGRLHVHRTVVRFAGHRAVSRRPTPGLRRRATAGHRLSQTTAIALMSWL